MLNNWAIITGASSGIGKSLAYEHAKRGGNLIIIARTEEALNALKSDLETQYKITVKVFVMDLIDVDKHEELVTWIKKEKIIVTTLINNAGFGGYGNFIDRNWKDDQKMIRLNIETLSSLCYKIIPLMDDAAKSYILNVASTAGFMPGPLQATYFATKAFVVSFSQALDHELKSKNISVTALCPGPVATNFGENAAMKNSPLFKNAVSADSVAKYAYKRMLLRKRIAINEWKLRIAIHGILPFLPSKIKTTMVNKMQKLN